MVKYKTETYTAHKAYTSFSKLSNAQAKAIQDSCYDNIPNVIEGIEIYDNYADFVPAISAYHDPGKVWEHNKKSGWYTHLKTGLKVKEEKNKSPNYDSLNGNGTCTTTLTVKIPQIDGRGTNPNSHHNKKKLMV